MLSELEFSLASIFAQQCYFCAGAVEVKPVVAVPYQDSFFA